MVIFHSYVSLPEGILKFADILTTRNAARKNDRFSARHTRQSHVAMENLPFVNVFPMNAYILLKKIVEFPVTTPFS